MNFAQVSKWLRRTPQPVTILVDGARRIPVGNRGGKWQEHVRTIAAMNPTKLECLDQHNNLIRAMLVDDDEDSEAPTEKKPAAPQGCCPSCGVSLNGFAGLLADAYERGSNAQRAAYQSIFEENTKLIQLLAERLGSIEVAWQRGLHAQAKLITEAATAEARAAQAELDAQEGDGGMLQALASGFMQAQGGAPAAPEEPPPRERRNGKGA